MSGGGSLSAGPPMSKFCKDLPGCQRRQHGGTEVPHTAESEHPSNDPLGREAPQMYLSQI
jgi:hypothetical protein